MAITPVWDYTDFIQLDEAGPCVICKEPTVWAELNFQCHLHPGPCDVALWEEYFEASRTPPEPLPD
jgi:hypothetical protein